ncbi:hypothetical protein Pyrfu_0304 [Pyrolobus fumarii 1A]|uniref:Uncharacterized protein n=1 Tax=Pyrolobus fumarii (strain DSM 11204 / 1A) TaxID=694429 RepID=G0EFD3_PYRF1|nr:hypothetical protein Pyrfu_0304 [Pyrolobus fumarii 1A]
MVLGLGVVGVVALGAVLGEGASIDEDIVCHAVLRG